VTRHPIWAAPAVAASGYELEDNADLLAWMAADVTEDVPRESVPACTASGPVIPAESPRSPHHRRTEVAA
jgi:hypothetical protein